MKNKGFVLGSVGLSVIVFAWFIMNKPDKQSETASQAPVTSKASIATETGPSEAFSRPHSPKFGNPMARVVVVEWLDPECEACREMHPFVKKIMKEYADRVQFVIRYMPYHKGSLFAAAALEEAREFGKFEEALTVLFENQPEWGDHHHPRSELIPSYLIKMGIPAQNLEREKVIAKHQKKIDVDAEDGEKVGVQGTPSFFINEKPLQELGDKPLRAAIERELAAASQP